MNHINTSFGFSTTRIGNVIIYACKLRINRVSENIEAHIEALKTAIPYALFSYDDITNYWTIEYSLTDFQKANYAQHSIGSLLKAHALEKVERKYDWLDDSNSFVYSGTMGVLNTTPMSEDPQQASYQNIRELIEQFDFAISDSIWHKAVTLARDIEDGSDIQNVYTDTALKISELRKAIISHIKAYPYDEVKIYEDMYRAKITAEHYQADGKELGVNICYFFGIIGGYWEMNIISDARRNQLHPKYGNWNNDKSKIIDWIAG